MEEDTMPFTALDKIAGVEKLQLLKAMLPYLENDQQKFFAVFVKILEIQNILAFFQQAGRLSPDRGPDVSMTEMMEEIRHYGNRSQREGISQALNLIQMMSLLQAFSEEGSSPDDLVSAFLTPEQQTMFSSFQAAFGTAEGEENPNHS